MPPTRDDVGGRFPFPNSHPQCPGYAPGAPCLASSTSQLVSDIRLEVSITQFARYMLPQTLVVSRHFRGLDPGNTQRHPFQTRVQIQSCERKEPPMFLVPTRGLNPVERVVKEQVRGRMRRSCRRQHACGESRTSHLIILCRFC